MANIRAIVLMTLAMAAFAVTDALIKAAAETIGAMQCMFVISSASLLFFLMLLWRNGGRLLSKKALGGAMLIRTGGEVLGTTSVISALAILPLSLVTALLQAQPLVLTAAAALLLKERVGWRRWLAVLAGFIGMMIVLRPGTGAFELALLLPLLGVIGLTARDIGTRLLPSEVGTAFATSWAVLSVACVGAVGTMITGGWRAMDGTTWSLVVAAALSFSLAYWSITSALRTGEVSAVAPFRYTRIIFAMAIAWTIFGERPDAAIWLGLTVITASGLYSFWRERELAKTADGA